MVSEKSLSTIGKAKLLRRLDGVFLAGRDFRRNWANARSAYWDVTDSIS
jgi:hypothetical protein